jgi:hypothetical protein
VGPLLPFYFLFLKILAFQNFKNLGGDLVRPRSQNLASPIFDVVPPSTLIRITAEIVKTMGGFLNLRRWNHPFRQCWNITNSLGDVLT